MESTSQSGQQNAVASKEWDGLVQPLAQMGSRLAALMKNPQDRQLRQELYRVLFSTISQAYVGLLHADPKHPDFWPIFNGAFNVWAPNPDAVLYSTPIEGNGIYRIAGFRGTSRMVDFSIGMGQLIPYGLDRQPGAVLADYDLDQLKIQGDGEFEVILSGERPAGYQGDWWKLDSKATYILVRQLAYDWLKELDARLTIERLDLPAIKPRQSADEIERRLRRIPDWVENWTMFTLNYFENFYLGKELINKVIVKSFADLGGLTNVQYVEGLFDLDSGDALIYESEVPPCRYWNIELTDMLWSTIDYMNRQTSLNGLTAKLDKDGKFRAVLSAKDPGVENWLDTAEYTRGAIFGRWMESSGDAPKPVLRKVKMAEVRDHLPKETAMVTAEDRDAALRRRRKGAQLRRRW